MLLWSITWIFVSLLLIILVHYLYSFFKNTLTIPKMRDLVNKPLERYNEIYTTIQHNNEGGKVATTTSSSSSFVDNTADMQNELKQFLQHLHTNDNIESHSLGSGSGNSSGSAFSSY